MAYGGTGVLPGDPYRGLSIGYSRTRFNDQATADDFSKIYKAAGSPKFQAGQYFTGEGGTKYKTVAGIDPNQPGWGNQVDPDYEFIGYQAPTMGTGRFDRDKVKQEGIAFLRERKKEEPKIVDPLPPPMYEDPPAPPPDDGGGGETGPSDTDLKVAELQDTIKDLVEGLPGVLGEQQSYFEGIIGQQNERFSNLQNMMIAQQQQRDRPTVMGVKTATGSGGNAMQIARRGVSGSFGRRGMRISSLNV